MNNAEEMTGLSREQVLAGIRSGKIHPNSRTVAQHGLSPQAIFQALPPPTFMVGCLASIPREIRAEIWPDDPYPQD